MRAKYSYASHTRPDNTTAYTAFDVVGTDAATNLIFTDAYGVPGSEILINRVTLRIDVNAVPSGMGAFRLHLYNSAPTAITDNSAYNLPSADRAKYLGWIDIDAPTDIGDTLYSDTKNVNFQAKLADGSTNLYGILQTIAAFTPSALTAKTIELHTLGV